MTGSVGGLQPRDRFWRIDAPVVLAHIHNKSESDCPTAKRRVASSLTHVAVDIEGAMSRTLAEAVGQAGRVGVRAIVESQSYLLRFLACRKDGLRTGEKVAEYSVGSCTRLDARDELTTRELSCLFITMRSRSMCVSFCEAAASDATT